MIDPSEIITNLVAMLRDIPDLVVEMDGDVERIYAYHDSYPKIQRQTDAEGLDYFEVPLSFTEIGDD